jgi:hypothetical protein
MSNQEELERLLQSFSQGLRIDLTPRELREIVIVRFDDGEIQVLPAEALERIE